MFYSEEEIYRNGWLDLVFTGRNKQYGAYVLRHEYSSTLLKAFWFSAGLFTGGVLLIFLLQHTAGADTEMVSIRTLDLHADKIYHIQQKKAVPHEASGPASEKSRAVKTIRAVSPTPADLSDAEEFPAMADLLSPEPGPVEADGEAGPALTGQDGSGEGTANTTGAGTDDENTAITIAEKSPEFPGGQEAFASFIRKNLHYPARAAEAGVAGKVYINFIVEKDGSISGVNLLRGIGFGCDEEALRVIRKAPKWIPGEQNGRKVRVTFTIPLAFQIDN